MSSSLGATRTTSPPSSGSQVLVRRNSDQHDDTSKHTNGQSEIPLSSTISTSIGAQDGIPPTLSMPPPSTAAPVTASPPSPPTMMMMTMDSALWSALHDPRERLPLLKLEQLLIELVQDPSLPYWDMGGPNHLTVLRAGDTANHHHHKPCGSTTPIPHVRPPSSFQRCCLHRLADRFGIRRDPTSYMPGYIRLYKVPGETQVPPVLLMEALELQQTESSHGGGVGDRHVVSEHKKPTTTTTTTTASATTSTTSSSSRNRVKSKRKTTILIKRSSSSNLTAPTGTTGASDNDTTNRNSSSSQGDKERAYAEARARIFGTQHGENNAPETTQEEGSANTIAATTTTTATTSMESSLQRASHSDSNNRAMHASTSDASMDTTTTTATTSKATWRNRREEVNDPDFQRAPVISYQPVYHHGYEYTASVPYVSPLPATSSTAAPFVPGDGYSITAASYQYSYRPPANVDGTEEFTSLGR